jgi:signal transduction histidine kinase
MQVALAAFGCNLIQDQNRGASVAKLRPRARIVRTIGDQLISGPEAALIELVKNAYDADSPSVLIVMEPPGSLSEGRKSGEILVSDSGHGMSAVELVEKWFEPATTDKVLRRESPKNRRMLGAKGVGRFATARLGQKLTLTCASSTAANALEVSTIVVNWADFETARYLDEVDIAIQTRSGLPGESQGVSLRITDLRDPWTKGQLELLIRELRRLASPRDAWETGFKIFLDLTGFTVEAHGFDGQALVAGVFGSVQEQSDVSPEDADPLEIRPFSLSNVFHYRIEGCFDNDGAFEGRFINQRAEGQERQLRLEAPSLEGDEQPCGSFKLGINVYDREGDAVVELFRKLGLSAIGRLDARRVLDENIGVGIYRGGFRIRPYGDAESDWLELERMRVQNPSRKLGLNQVFGIIDIADEDLSGLIERSSREGLEHNGSFTRLKRLVADLMANVEQLRVDFREMVGLSRKQEGETDTIRNQANLNATAKAVAALPPQFRDRVERALKQERKALKSQIEDLEGYQQKLAAQSGLGLVVSQVLHDGRRFLGDINTRAKVLVDGAPRLSEQSGFGAHFRDTLGKNAGSIHNSAGHLTKLFRSLDPLASRKRGSPKSLHPAEVIERCLALFADAIAAANVTVARKIPEDLPAVTLYEGDLMAAVLNIIDNAVHWLSTSTVNPRLLSIQATSSKKFVRILISNNGPSIEPLFQKNLFNPGFSLKSDGSGLGLAIAREAMKASKGNVIFDETADETTFLIAIQRL